VAEERVELSCPKALVSKTSVSSKFHHSAKLKLSKIEKEEAGSPVPQRDKWALTAETRGVRMTQTVRRFTDLRGYTTSVRRRSG
jgi:hypothetical protein